jgi:hypothetical protein
VEVQVAYALLALSILPLAAWVTASNQGSFVFSWVLAWALTAISTNANSKKLADQFHVAVPHSVTQAVSSATAVMATAMGVFGLAVLVYKIWLPKRSGDGDVVASAGVSRWAVDTEAQERLHRPQ